MSIDYTSTALIESVKRRALIPRSQMLYPSEDIAAILTEELHSDIVPLIMDVREEYFVTFYDQTIDTSVNSYQIHSRAIGNKLRDVVLLNTNGLEVSVPRGEADHLKHQWGTGNSGPYLNQLCFIYQDDQITLFPNASALGTYQLRQKYFRRPNNICLESAAGKITVKDSATKTLTLNNMPASWSTLTSCDIIKGSPSFRSHGDDLAISSVDVTAKTVTLTAAIPTNVAVGDWVTEPGISPVAQIPYEVHKLLEQRTAIKLLEGLGDTEGLRSAADVYKDMVDKFRSLVTPRADGSPKRIVSSGPLFGSRRNPSGWW